MLPLRCLPPLFAAFFVPVALPAHETFLPVHHHTGPHAHGGEAHAGHAHAEPGGKHGEAHLVPALTEERFAMATGARFTRYSVEGEKAHLWETGVAIDYAVLPWLHVGGDVSYGWFDSVEGKADGWLTPSAHLDFHLPLSGAWEVIAGLEVGFPGGEEALVGDHWSWVPHVELRYDPGAWFAEAGLGLDLLAGGSEHDHEADDHAHEETDHEAHTADFHEIVDPHGDQELEYFAAAGIRLLDRRLTLGSRLSGVHVLSGDTPAENYLRAGLRASFAVHARVLITTDASVPLTSAERNEWQASVGLRIGF